MPYKDSHLKELESDGKIYFRHLINDGTPEALIALTAAKNVIQKQLPKMPKEYITRLVYDCKHQSLILCRRSDFGGGANVIGTATTTSASSPGNTGNDDAMEDDSIANCTDESMIGHKQSGCTNATSGGTATVQYDLPNVLGVITYRSFIAQEFAEIVFCAISSNEQVQGYGSYLMCRLKEVVKRDGIKHFLTYADNYAIGYFKKQGFTKTISLPGSQWQGYIKDYDGGTLMQCTLVPGIDYSNMYALLAAQRQQLHQSIQRYSTAHIVHSGLPAESFPLLRVKGDGSARTFGYEALKGKIPGLAEAGWTKEMHEQLISKSRSFYPTASSPSGVNSRSKVGSPVASHSANQPVLYDFLRPLLAELQAHPAAWPFQDPVDAKEVPDYYDVIRHPMDLSSIQAKLYASPSCQYTSLEAFVGDVQLMLANCRAFNDASSQYVKCADRLAEFFSQRLAQRQAHKQAVMHQQQNE